MKKNTIGFLLLFVGLAAICACTSCSKKQESLYALKTSDYSISLPKNWTVKRDSTEKKDSPSFHILNKDVAIGGVDILSYDPATSIEPLFGNHVAGILEKKDLNTSKTPAKQSLIERNWNEDRHAYVDYELHTYFIPPNGAKRYGQGIAYDFSLNSGYIDQIAKPEMASLKTDEAKKLIFDRAGIDEQTYDAAVKSFLLSY